jgi:uncharacterized glyoxalase superfamily protein PhnB
MLISPSIRVDATPVLPVADMEPAIAFYRLLGFEVTLYDAGYAWVSHAGHELLHLLSVPGLDVDANAASCYLHVADGDALHEAWAAAGMAVGPLEDTPWGMREFAMLDPSLNRVRVGHAR